MKLICFFERRNGMSQGEFIDYYETHHAPLFQQLCPFFSKYTRSFVVQDEAYAPAHATNDALPQPDFDVITEVWFESRRDYDKMLETLADPRVGDIIRADEANLFDRNTMRMYLVEEYETVPRGRNEDSTSQS